MVEVCTFCCNPWVMSVVLKCLQHNYFFTHEGDVKYIRPFHMNSRNILNVCLLKT